MIQTRRSTLPLIEGLTQAETVMVMEVLSERSTLKPGGALSLDSIFEHLGDIYNKLLKHSGKALASSFLYKITLMLSGVNRTYSRNYNQPISQTPGMLYQ